MATVTGGEKLKLAMTKIAAKLKKPQTLRVGFLENATYPDGGLNVASVAAIQNFGAPNAGIPPRPFFSNMVASEKVTWADKLTKILKANDFDVANALELLGKDIAGALRQSVIDTNEPPLKPATVAAKGFDKPLIDTSNMINSIDSEVVS